MPSTYCLADTNILLRLNSYKDPDFTAIRDAVRSLTGRGFHICYTPRNIIEFWNACTRPSQQNGYGLSIADTQRRIGEIEGAFTLLPDNEQVYPEWRRLVEAHSVFGAQVHDARLVAAMLVHDVASILTLNKRDFMRYPGIAVEHPRDVV
jgi:predicted nucleic acid-binding protein